MTSSPGSEAIASYMDLCSACDQLRESECYQLKEWAFAICRHWKIVLKENISRLVIIVVLHKYTIIGISLYISEVKKLMNHLR